MVSDDLFADRRDNLNVEQEDHPSSSCKKRQPGLTTAQFKRFFPRLAATAKPTPKTSLQHSDDLDAAKGIFVGIILGLLFWGLLGVVLYLVFS